MTFPIDQKMLMDPNIWIAGTAATVYTTPCAYGMSDSMKAGAHDSITVGILIFEDEVGVYCSPEDIRST
jgi:hypothetical protein